VVKADLSSDLQAAVDRVDFANGGTMGGSLVINGDLTVNGISTTVETFNENINVEDNTITLRHNATTGLQTGDYTGIIAHKYDGTNNGMLVFDNTGTAYVGDEGDLQPLATRDLSADGALVSWDNTNKILVRAPLEKGSGFNSIQQINNTASGDNSFASGKDTYAGRVRGFAAEIASTYDKIIIKGIDSTIITGDLFIVELDTQHRSGVYQATGKVGTSITVDENANTTAITFDDLSQIFDEWVDHITKIWFPQKRNIGNIWINHAYNTAEGQGSNATGHISHAEGLITIAAGRYSHAEGEASMALDINSHAEGYGGKALGPSTHVEGTKNTALLHSAHAEGYNTIAGGKGSHSEGFETKALNEFTHAEGRGTKASGPYAHAEGLGTDAEA
jgi:hypothetical protein